MNPPLTSGVNHIYIIDNDLVSQHITERLIKNEWGSISLLSFESCEMAMQRIQSQEDYYSKEYPQLIILGSELNEACVTRFLNELKKQRFNCLVYAMCPGDPNLYRSINIEKPEIKGYLSKPIRRRSLSAIFESFNTTEELFPSA